VASAGVTLLLLSSMFASAFSRMNPAWTMRGVDRLRAFLHLLREARLMQT
jgi:hypothetical protein